MRLCALDETFLDACAELLASRHAEHVIAQPLLDPGYAHPQRALAEIRALFESEQASGAVAIEGRELIGFIVGRPRPGSGSAASVWGPNAWVDVAGHAARDPEVVRDLYGFAAQRWVEEGRTAHYVVVPAHDPDVIDAWFRLGFGQQQVHGVRAPEDLGEASWLRPASKADLDVLVELDRSLPLHQGLSPVFSSGGVPTAQESSQEWAETFEDSGYRTLVAVSNEAVVGAVVMCGVDKSSAHSGLARPDLAGYFAWAAVLPDSRGKGIGRALAEAAVTWSSAVGYRSVVTDWRATNLLSSRAWPAVGFTPTFHRLHRVVGY